MTEVHTISILCVDDDSLFLASFMEHLTQRGFQVTAVHSVHEALGILENEQFDVITSEYAMQEMDGLSFLKEIRSRGCHSLFIVVTGKRLAHISIDALNAGADYYIQKGSDPNQEVNRLAEFLRQKLRLQNAKREIEEWERFYEHVIESQPEIVCRFGPDGMLVYLNQAGMRFFKISFEQMHERNYLAFLPGDEREQVKKHLAGLSAISPDILIEHQIQNGEGKTALFQWGYHGFFGPGGIATEFQAMGRNASSLIRISAGDPACMAPESPASASVTAPVSGQTPVPADTVQETPEMEEPADWSGLVDTIQNLDNPVFAVDRNGIIVAWNNALEQLTGVPANSMIGKGNREYALPFYGKPVPMLIDHIIRSPDIATGSTPAIKKVGDTFIGNVEHVKIRGKPMLLWGKGSPVYNAKGTLIAAIEAITVGEPPPDTGSEEYLGGISSITLKTSGEGMGGAIAGAIGSSTGGFGVYTTTKRLFVIRHPDMNPETGKGVQFGTFMMDELFGTNVDTRPKSIEDLEKYSIFGADKENISLIELKKPVLLSGYLTITLKDKSSFRVYIDHKKAFGHIEQLMKAFLPESLKIE